MNFFRRRKILKRVNALELVPVRLMEHTMNNDGKITILMPRFSGKLTKAFQTQQTERKYIRINLDFFGSKAWELMDGNRNADAISREMLQTFPEKFRDEAEVRERVSAFLSRLYQERYITFQQLLGLT